ncbi:MAG TPA: tRNA (adenosine(37)-N6)-threonylcarbamoyltransferase complex ATPase subunit type 1 TsaE [Candidatus Paceibacterota bacterium]
MRFKSTSPRNTAFIASGIIGEILKKKRKKEAVVISLVGDLGAGKTTLVKAFARAIGVKKKIISPTFLIIRRIKIFGHKKFENFFHVDAYRIKPKDIINLGFKDVLKNEKNIIVIEWGDRIKKILPRNTTWINLKHSSNVLSRIIDIKKI